MDQLDQQADAQAVPEVGEVRHGFMLGEHRLLLKAGTLAELAGKTPICALPDTPAWFAGFINHRGHTVPVYDLNLLAGCGATDLSRQYWILLLDPQPATFGVILRQLPAAINDPEVCQSEPETALSAPVVSSISGLYRVDEQIWFELDHRVLMQQLKTIFRGTDGAGATE